MEEEITPENTHTVINTDEIRAAQAEASEYKMLYEIMQERWLAEVNTNTQLKLLLKKAGY